jgi:hypothetical protein
MCVKKLPDRFDNIALNAWSYPWGAGFECRMNNEWQHPAKWDTDASTTVGASWHHVVCTYGESICAVHIQHITCVWNMLIAYSCRLCASMVDASVGEVFIKFHHRAVIA